MEQKVESNKKIKSIGFKMFTIFILGFLFYIPLLIVQSITNDRAKYQDVAINSIISPMGGEFELTRCQYNCPVLHK